MTSRLTVPALLLAITAHAGEIAAPTNTPPIRQISPSEFAIGLVQLDQSRKTVTIPAVVNMERGAVEYLLVTPTGKVHESLFRTDAEPYHLHLAFLLLGARGDTNTTRPELPPGGYFQKSSPHPKSPRGEIITIEIVRTSGGVEKRNRAEDWILNIDTMKAMSLGPWIYNGSRLVDGKFLAQVEGSLASIIIDPDSLINNPRPGSDNDQIWLVNTNSAAPINSPVRMIFRLEPPESPVKP